MLNLEQKCCGCGGCAVVCPVGAVRLKRNREGFYQAYTDSVTCVNCNLCNKVCPIENTECGTPISAYSFKSKHEDVLSKSASGGFAYELSKAKVSKIPVCSVYYDKEEQEPRHIVRSSVHDLGKNRNSFYLQSYPVDGMRDIIEQKRGVVIGSPCQIAAMDKILSKKRIRENYLLVDFFCHGVPSYFVWEKYIAQYVSEFSSPISAEFRNKRNGWGKYTILLDDGIHRVYSEKVENKDIFFRIFLENMAMNHACYTCPYHAQNSCADIRMGDFWGEKFKHDKEGVSAILVFSNKGEETLKELRKEGNLQHDSVECVLDGQIQGNLPIPSCRAELIAACSTPKTLKQINDTVILKYKIKRKINRLMKRDFI